MVRNLAADCYLWKSLIGHHVKDILLGLWKVVFYYSLSVAITDQRSLTRPKTPPTLELEGRFRNVRTTRKDTFWPVSPAKVQAQCPTGGRLRPEYCYISQQAPHTNSDRDPEHLSTQTF